MIAQVASTFWMRLGPAWLAGPIFDKELRVASRRRRPYVLRFAYVGLLAIFLVYLWCATVRFQGTGTPVVQVSRLGEFGKQIVLVVIWFQFIAGQLLAAVLLSDAIGSEIRRRTLDVLLVTPIRSFQIVMGKLLSTLLQAASLWAISLPILAVVRVFGGVPWDSVVAGLCVTFSAGLFTGALSLCLSISSRRPYSAVLSVGTWYLVAWVLVPAVHAALFPSGSFLGVKVKSILHLTNPFAVLVDLTQGLLVGSGVGGAAPSWPENCLILLGLAGIVLAWSVLRVRRVARHVASRRVGETTGQTNAGRLRPAGAIRPVTGSPIVWKERCSPLFRKRWQSVFWACVLAGAVGVPLGLRFLTGATAHVVFFPVTSIFRLLFVIGLAVGAAGAVAKEKEARTWPILLTTPLEDREIIKGKAMGVFRRNLPLLLPMPVLYLLLFPFGPSHSRTLSELLTWALVLVWGLAGTAFFLLGTGLYFSTRCKTTGAAVVATLAVYYAPQLFFCGILSPVFVLSSGMLASMAGRAGSSVALAAVLISIAPTMIYMGLGLLFMRLAIGRVRRDIF